MRLRKPFLLKWSEENYSVVISMAVIDRIDDEINILSLTRMGSESEFRITKVAKLIYILLDEAGADVTYESVYEGMSDSGKIDQSQLFSVIGEILPQLLPSFDGVAKKKAPSRKVKQRRQKT